MAEMKITFARFLAAKPAPASHTRAYGNRKELTLEEVPDGFNATEHGLTYKHPHYGMILVPWVQVDHCRVEPVKKRRPGRPPKAKPAA